MATKDKGSRNTEKVAAKSRIKERAEMRTKRLAAESMANPVGSPSLRTLSAASHLPDQLNAVSDRLRVAVSPPSRGGSLPGTTGRGSSLPRS